MLVRRSWFLSCADFIHFTLFNILAYADWRLRVIHGYVSNGGILFIPFVT